MRSSLPLGYALVCLFALWASAGCRYIAGYDPAGTTRADAGADGALDQGRRDSQVDGGAIDRGPEGDLQADGRRDGPGVGPDSGSDGPRPDMRPDAAPKADAAPQADAGQDAVPKTDATPPIWTQENTSGPTLRAVWGSSSSHVAVAVGDGAHVIRRDTNGTWSQEVPPVANSLTLRAVWGAADNEIYIAGDNSTLLHTKAPTMFKLHSIPGSLAPLHAVWGGNTAEVALGEAHLRRSAATSWTATKAQPPSPVLGMWAVNTETFFVVTSDSKAFRYDGGTVNKWTAISGLQSTLAIAHAIYGRAGGAEIYVVGEKSDGSGAVVRHTSQGWTELLPTPGPLFGIHGVQGEIITVGADWYVYRSTNSGTSFALVQNGPSGISLRAVWVYGSGRAYIVGDGGLVLHYRK